ncbi:hypothetical protein BDE02_11G012300 [Populus trichocarpa]|nr:hypothetical protein BDE02_11G012300 [Populus trichocarpa]
MAAGKNQESYSSRFPNCKYQVFLSFRGEDTRKNFTDHLYTALVQAGIHTFRDDNEIRRWARGAVCPIYCGECLKEFGSKNILCPLSFHWKRSSNTIYQLMVARWIPWCCHCFTLWNWWSWKDSHS